MRLTFFSDYGLRVLMRLAGTPDKAFSTRELADEFGVSTNHLAKVFSALAAAGLVSTRRGGNGGARLARPADEILLGEVVKLLEADRPLVECFAKSGNRCTLSPGCHLKPRLARAEDAFLAELNRTTLADCSYVPATN